MGVATQVKRYLISSILQVRGYSSGVEHLTADQEVPGSNPGAPFTIGFPAHIPVSFHPCP